MLQDGTTETNHGLIDYVVVASVDWLDSHKAETRDQIVKTLNEVTLERNAAVNEVGSAARQTIIGSGAMVRELTPELNQT